MILSQGDKNQPLHCLFAIEEDGMLGIFLELGQPGKI